MKSARENKHKYINGTKGVISLLLCFVMCPFLTIALTLVESARYQQALESLNEVNNSASMSTLADMDSYLEKRFGLLAVSQDGSIDANYQKYLQMNWGAMGDGAKLNSASVNSENSLSLTDKTVLKQQILEFSELTVSSEVVADGLDLTELIATLEKIGDLEAIKKSFDAISATAKVASAAADLVKNVNDILVALADFGTKYSTYISTHDEFLTAALDLQATIKVEMEADPNLCYPGEMTPTPSASPTDPTPTPASAKTSVYDNPNVIAKITILDQKTTVYQTACDVLSVNVDGIKSGLEKIVENLNTMQEKIDKLTELTEEDSSSETAAVSASAGASTGIYQLMFDNFEKAFVDYGSAATIDGLEQNVTDLKETSLNLGNFDVKTITHETTSTDIEAIYAVLADIGVPDAELLNTALTAADSILGGEDGGDSIVTIIENMVNSINGLFEIDVFYDGSLDANINTDYMSSLNAATGSAPSSAQQVLDSIKTMLDASDEFKNALDSWDLLTALKAIVTALDAVVMFFNAITSWFEGICSRIYELVTGGANGFYESMLVCGYCAYDFPNRTNYKNKGTGGLDDKALTGYSYSDIAAAESSSGAGYGGDLNALIDLLKNLDEDTSEDRTFCGAELEYILVGSQSEIVNQASTFVYLYLLRIILNIIPIVKSPEVAEMGAAATVGAPLVYVLEFIAEPLCDTIILANGGDSYLVKSKVYLTPTGALKLVEDLMAVTEISAALQEKILKSGQSDAKPGDKTGGTMDDFFKDGLFKLDYKDHILFMLMFTCPQEEALLPRVQQLIQMEAESYYKKEAADFTFDLKKTYAYLNFNIDATLNPLFSVGNLSKTGYPYKKSIYRGY